MRNKRLALFRGRHLQDEIIVLCLRWYLRYSLSYRDLEEMMAERDSAWIIPRSLAGFYAMLPFSINGFAVRCANRTAPGGWTKHTVE